MYRYTFTAGSWTYSVVGKSLRKALNQLSREVERDIDGWIRQPIA